MAGIGPRLDPTGQDMDIGSAQLLQIGRQPLRHAAAVIDADDAGRQARQQDRHAQFRPG